MVLKNGTLDIFVQRKLINEGKTCMNGMNAALDLKEVSRAQENTFWH